MARRAPPIPQRTNRKPLALTVGVLEERFLPLFKRARLIPGIEVVDIDAAHAVNAQNPAQWNKAVGVLLGRHQPIR